MSKRLICLISALFLFSACVPAFAATGASQEMSGQVRTLQMEERERQLRKQIQQKEETPEIKSELPAAPAEVDEAAVKARVDQINVIGVTLLSQKELQAIIAQFQGKELTLAQMQQVAGMITDAYRQKGFITSRAYLAPQKIEGGILEVRVIEGLMGDLNVTGNKFFKTRIFTRQVAMKKGEPFDYNKLREGLSRINQYRDRNAKAVLVPGKDPGTTDVTLEVKDNLPIHVALDWDNFGSQYIGKNRWEGTLIHNNLLGFDDSLTVQYQLAEADAYDLGAMRYLFPVTNATEVGFFMAKTRTELGKEFEDLEARGKATYYSLFGSHDLVTTENVSLSLNAGFDYKDVFNFQSGDMISKDRMRVIKTSANLDVSDSFGRTIFDNEVNFGIPNMMGGLKATDPAASTVGSGGQFVRYMLTLLRLQEMPLSSTLLWKNQCQFSSQILTATEQFQLGGIANLRGYPSAELVGDNGFTTTLEWSMPPYFVPKNMKVPLSKGMLYDSLRMVVFYDWGNVRLRNPQAGEEKSESLHDAGCGIRFNLPENFSVRIDIGWALGKSPSDGDGVHPWFQVRKEF